MHIVLVGATCAGKSTLAKYLVKCGFRRIITRTTRPKRDHEVDASTMRTIKDQHTNPTADYYFVSMDEFNKAEENGYFAETTSYNASFGYCKYGSLVEDWKSSDNTVCVLNPDGVRQLKKADYDIFVVYVNNNLMLCLDRARQRGDDDEEIARRMVHDMIDLSKFEKERLYDIKVPCNEDIENVAQTIMKAVNA